MTRLALAFAAVVGLTAFVHADDEAKKVVAKAIKAHGGAEALARFREKSVEQEGKIVITQMNNLEAKMHVYSGKKKFKQVIELTLNGTDIKQEVGFNGKELWIAVNGKVVMTLKDEQLAPVHEALHAEEAVSLALLGDKSVELSIIGESKLDDKPVIGIRVSSKGRKDVSLFFDKESGLLAKIESRALDPQSGQEVDEERILSDYKTMNGYSRPRRVVIARDRKKVAEIEFTDTKFVDQFDDSVFAKPE